MVAQRQGWKVFAALWMAGITSVVRQRLAELAWTLLEMRKRPPFGEFLHRQFDTSRCQRVMSSYRPRANWNYTNNFDTAVGRNVPNTLINVFLVTQDGYPKQLFVGIMHFRQRSTITERSALALQREPTALLLARQRLTQGQSICLDLVLHASSRVLSLWPRALARKTRHLQHSACGILSSRFSNRP
jgi:hypothetical protein